MAAIERSGTVWDSVHKAAIDTTLAKKIETTARM